MKSGQIDALNSQLDAMCGYLSRDEGSLQRQLTGVSGWSIAEHLDHSARVCSAILGQVLKPGEPIRKPLSTIGRIVLMIGYIPRGKGRSPESMRGQMTPGPQINSSIEETRSLLRSIGSSSFVPESRPIVKHPVFGGLTASQALRFAAIHNNHHLKIVREIEKQL